MNRKQIGLIGVTITGLVAMNPLGAIRNNIALAQTSLDLATVRSAAMSKHNTYRTTHRSPNVTISDSLNNTAQTWAEYLATNAVLQHSTPSQRNNAGENIYVSYTTATSVAPDTLANGAVTSWYNEVSAYNYDSPGFNTTTGHFTQVVWKNSTQLGCGAAKGVKTINSKQYNAFYVVCQYAPAGNVTGQFPDNVLKP